MLLIFLAILKRFNANGKSFSINLKTITHEDQHQFFVVVGWKIISTNDRGNLSTCSVL